MQSKALFHVAACATISTHWKIRFEQLIRKTVKIEILYFNDAIKCAKQVNAIEMRSEFRREQLTCTEITV